MQVANRCSNNERGECREREWNERGEGPVREDPTAPKMMIATSATKGARGSVGQPYRETPSELGLSPPSLKDANSGPVSIKWVAPAAAIEPSASVATRTTATRDGADRPSMYWARPSAITTTTARWEPTGRGSRC